MSRPLTDPSPPATPFSCAADGVRVRVRVTPRSRRPGVEAPADDGDGRPLLKVCVRAAPADGEANAALLSLLAHEWGLPKSALSVVAGGSARAKTIGIAGDGTALMADLVAWWRERRGARGEQR